MKKNYVKPFASFESFELSANIAGTCVVSVQHSTDNCRYVMPELGHATVFSRGICDYNPEDNDPEFLCYNGALNSLFAS